MTRSAKVLLASGALMSVTAAVAAETITYTYDARGRLVKVERKGTVNHGVSSQYRYDKADNRLNVAVTSRNPPP